MSDNIVKLAKTFYEERKNELTLTKSKESWRLKTKNFRPTRWEQLGYTPKSLHTDYGIFADEESFTTFYGTVLDLFVEEPYDMPEELQDITLVMDVMSGEFHVVQESGVMPYSYDGWKKKTDPEAVAILEASSDNGVVTFNPFKNLLYEDKVETPIGPQVFPHYNRYIKPEWLFQKKPSQFPLCEKYVKPFLELLLPNEDERIRVMIWMRGVTTGRRNDVLVLVGTKGNGKGMLMDLVSAMVGVKNQITAGSAFGQDKFNSEIAFKQFLRTDEWKLKGDRKESIKRFTNDYITVEFKGQDPFEVENFCSFALATNYEENVNIEYDDRRFFAPRVQNRNLITVMKREDIAELRDMTRNSIEFQTELPYWLDEQIEASGIDYSGDIPYRTDRFYELVEKSKFKWWREFKNILKLKESCTLEEVRTLTKQRQVTDLKIKEMIEYETLERENIEKERLTMGKEPGAYVPFEICTPVNEPGLGVKYVSHIYEGETSNEEYLSTPCEEDAEEFF